MTEFAGVWRRLGLLEAGALMLRADEDRQDAEGRNGMRAG
jgi:hypothetical protein